MHRRIFQIGGWLALASFAAAQAPAPDLVPRQPTPDWVLYSALFERVASQRDLDAKGEANLTAEQRRAGLHSSFRAGLQKEIGLATGEYKTLEDVAVTAVALRKAYFDKAPTERPRVSDYTAQQDAQIQKLKNALNPVAFKKVDDFVRHGDRVGIRFEVQ
jgi:hypothetical protein